MVKPAHAPWMDPVEGQWREMKRADRFTFAEAFRGRNRCVDAPQWDQITDWGKVGEAVLLVERNWLKMLNLNKFYTGLEVT